MVSRYNVLLLALTSQTLTESPSLAPYAHLSREEKRSRAIAERIYFESTGRLPADTPVTDPDTGRIIYHPLFWTDKRDLFIRENFPSSPHSVENFFSGPEIISPRRLLASDQASGEYFACPDGETMCLESTQTCENCYCYAFERNYVHFGTILSLRGNSDSCFWSGCECVNLV